MACLLPSLCFPSTSLPNGEEDALEFFVDCHVEFSMESSLSNMFCFVFLCFNINDVSDLLQCSQKIASLFHDPFSPLDGKHFTT